MSGKALSSDVHSSGNHKIQQDPRLFIAPLFMLSVSQPLALTFIFSLMSHCVHSSARSQISHLAHVDGLKVIWLLMTNYACIMHASKNRCMILLSRYNHFSKGYQSRINIIMT
jgi:hypothetical protein